MGLDYLVQATINQLGYGGADGEYEAEADVHESVIDLLRFLRNDDSDLTVRSMCCERNLIRKDLIPMLKSSTLNKKLFNPCIRLIANLSIPIDGFFRKQEADKIKDKAEKIQKLQTFWFKNKLAFCDTEFFSILKLRLEQHFLETLWEERLEEDNDEMRLICLLLKNIIYFPENSTLDRTEYARRRESVITSFLESEILKVFVFIGESAKDHAFHLHALEIFGLLFRTIDPAVVCDTAKNAGNSEGRKKAEAEMMRLVQEEENRNLMLKQSATTTRHSRFGGSYFIKGKSSIDASRPMICTRIVKDPAKELDFNDQRKHKKIQPKNRRIEEDTSSTSLVMTVEFAKILDQNIKMIIEKTYNNLARNCREKALVLASVQEDLQIDRDLSYWTFIAFSISFVRHAKLGSDYVTASIGKEVFHFTQVKLAEYLEMGLADKSKTKFLAKRALFAMRAYKELLLYHRFLKEEGTLVEKERADETFDYILRVEEYRDLSISLFKQIKPAIVSMGFLRELITATHYYLKIFKKSCKEGALKVMKKQRKKKSAKKKTVKEESASLLKAERRRMKKLDKLPEEKLQSLWKEHTGNLEEFSEETIDTSDMAPVDYRLQVADDDQKLFLMLRIQRTLRDGNLAMAASLNKAGRELYPDDGVFGVAAMSSDDLAQHLKEIFFTDFTEVVTKLEKAEDEVQEKLNEGLEEKYDGNSDDEDEDDDFDEVEVEIEYTMYMKQFLRPDVLQWYFMLMRNFQRNSTEVNLAITTMLFNAAFDLKEPTRIYQVTLFNMLHEIDQAYSALPQESRKSSRLYELHKFGNYFLKKFFEGYEKGGDLAAARCLFWKNKQDILAFDHGITDIAEEGDGAPKKRGKGKKKAKKHVETLDFDPDSDGERGLQAVDPDDLIPAPRKSLPKRKRRAVKSPASGSDEEPEFAQEMANSSREPSPAREDPIMQDHEKRRRVQALDSDSDIDINDPTHALTVKDVSPRRPRILVSDGSGGEDMEESTAQEVSTLPQRRRLVSSGSEGDEKENVTHMIRKSADNSPSNSPMRKKARQVLFDSDSDGL
ncbi:unnamed protein product, partial [Mesorhabditis spiculigera]